MAFEGLTTRLDQVFKKLKKRGKVQEADINEVMREVRLALLEADVNFKVVKDFIGKVKTQSLGVEVQKSFTPAMSIIEIVNKELTDLMGGTQQKLLQANKPPTVVLLAGLQGAGKTTFAAKLAHKLQKEHHKPLLVAGDIYRPAAIKQLQILGSQTAIPVFSLGDQVPPPEITKQALQQAKENGNDYVLIDTAGRMQIDHVLMREIKEMHEALNPTEVLLVVDAMTGQEAVNVAQQFHDQLVLTGVVLTKFDGDTRGGAALSIKAVTGLPIKFVSIGEKIGELEAFHPDRMASRILGMGDMLSLIEKAQTNLDATKASELEQKMRNADFSFDDFLEQMSQVRKMGPLDQLLDMIPGMKQVSGKDLKLDEKNMDRTEAIVKSMTKQEKHNPAIMNYSRRKRIASGSGTNITEVNRLLRQFEEMKKMMKQFTTKGFNGSKGNMPSLKGMKKGKKSKKRFPF